MSRKESAKIRNSNLFDDSPSAEIQATLPISVIKTSPGLKIDNSRQGSFAPEKIKKKMESDDISESDNSEKEEEEDFGNYEEEEDPFTAIIGVLASHVESGLLADEDLQDIIIFVEKKLKDNAPVKLILAMISSTGLPLVKKLAKANKSDVNNNFMEIVDSNECPKAQSLDIGRDECLPTNPITSIMSNTRSPASDDQFVCRGEKDWIMFADEYDCNKTLTEMEREIWKAQMKVKIELAKELSKELTAKMAHKTYSKFKVTDCFDRWARDFKTELLPIPLCAKRLELGHLVNPRMRPDPHVPLFKDENGKFDVDGYNAALLLFELAEKLISKIGGFIYGALTYCMAENDDAQQVVRSDTEKNFFTLFRRLSERFKKNSDVEKQRLTNELKGAIIGPKETLRAFYGRIITLATELKTVFGREIPDDDIKALFLKALSDTSKNNFLQLENDPLYNDNLNKLCYEVIKRDERLQQSLDSFTSVTNNVTANAVETWKRFKGTCFSCGKLGHRVRDCKTRSIEVDANDNVDSRQSRDKSYANKQNFKKKRMKYAMGGTGRKMRDDGEEANVVESEYDASRYECFLCHERCSHNSENCPNVDIELTLKNMKYRENEEKNRAENKANPQKKYLLV